VRSVSGAPILTLEPLIIAMDEAVSKVTSSTGAIRVQLPDAKEIQMGNKSQPRFRQALSMTTPLDSDRGGIPEDLSRPVRRSKSLTHRERMMIKCLLQGMSVTRSKPGIQTKTPANSDIKHSRQSERKPRNSWTGMV
jgi:hypothetical protein